MTKNLFKKNNGNWAIVVGSAEGLGEAYSIALAKRNINLIMVDNKQNSLSTLAKQLENDFNIETIELCMDLLDADAVAKMMNEIKKVDCRLLIYNAGYSLIQPFTTLTEEDLDCFVDINTRSQLKLIHQFSKLLVDKKQVGGILLMSSLAGLIGMQLVSTYAATKAFAWNLAEGLHYELKPKNIHVMSCIAGATLTPTYLKNKPKYGRIKPLVMTSEDVAESALNTLGKKALYIPGFSNRVNYFILTRLLPRKLAASIANKTMRSMFEHQSKS